MDRPALWRERQDRFSHGCPPCPQVQGATNDIRNKFEQAREELRDMLVNGAFAPNTRLTETKLADTLQISRGTLRSVFASLANEGYLTLERNRGAHTRFFSIEEATTFSKPGRSSKERLPQRRPGMPLKRSSRNSVTSLRR